MKGSELAILGIIGYIVYQAMQPQTVNASVVGAGGMPYRNSIPPTISGNPPTTTSDPYPYGGGSDVAQAWTDPSLGDPFGFGDSGGSGRVLTPSGDLGF